MPIRRRDPITGEVRFYPTQSEMSEALQKDPEILTRPMAGNLDVMNQDYDSRSVFGTYEDAWNWVNKNPQFANTELWLIYEDDDGDWVVYVAHYEE